LQRRGPAAIQNLINIFPLYCEIEAGSVDDLNDCPVLPRPPELFFQSDRVNANAPALCVLVSPE
jgi:hypothetical protein